MLGKAASDCVDLQTSRGSDWFALDLGIAFVSLLCWHPALILHGGLTWQPFFVAISPLILDGTQILGRRLLHHGATPQGMCHGGWRIRCAGQTYRSGGLQKFTDFFPYSMNRIDVGISEAFRILWIPQHCNSGLSDTAKRQSQPLCRRSSPSGLHQLVAVLNRSGMGARCGLVDWSSLM